MNIVEDRTQFWIDRYIRHLAATASSSTLGAYGFDLYQAQEYALDNGLPGIDKWQREHADSWARWLKGDKLYSDRTIQRRQHAMRSLHHFLIDQGVRQDVACATVGKRRNRRPRTLDSSELYRMLTIRTKMGERYGCLIELMYATGARSSEIVALQLGDVQVLSGSKAAITLARGRKQRIVPLYRAATIRLIEYLRDQRPEAVKRARSRSIALFPGKRDDGYLTRQFVNQLIDETAAVSYTHLTLPTKRIV